MIVDINNLKLLKVNESYITFIRSSALYPKIRRQFNNDVKILSIDQELTLNVNTKFILNMGNTQRENSSQCRIPNS